MRKLLYFSAPCCGPCKMFSPLMEIIGQELPVEKIDVDADPETAKQYNIASIPAVVLLDEDSKEMDRFIGVKSKHTIVEFYNQIKK